MGSRTCCPYWSTNNRCLEIRRDMHKKYFKHLLIIITITTALMPQANISSTTHVLSYCYTMLTTERPGHLKDLLATQKAVLGSASLYYAMFYLVQQRMYWGSLALLLRVSTSRGSEPSNSQLLVILDSFIYSQRQIIHRALGYILGISMPERARESDNQSWFMHPSSPSQNIYREKKSVRERYVQGDGQRNTKRRERVMKIKKERLKISQEFVESLDFNPLDLKLKKR